MSQAAGDQQVCGAGLGIFWPSPRSHPLGWAPGPWEGDVLGLEAFLGRGNLRKILEPMTRVGWGASVEVAAHVGRTCQMGGCAWPPV